MGNNNPGGWVGLMVLFVIFVLGHLLEIGWMINIGGYGLALWLAMLILGFLLGAKG